MDSFATRALDWYDRHGRKHLPWQTDRTPYRVWVSEIMLQQTQVATVIPYFARFVERFPNVSSLANAELDEVLHLWTGLGYYARGRNLHVAAKKLMREHNGELPDSYDALTALPGIGRSTAGAILASAFGIRAPILDGNAKRVLARFHAEHASSTQSIHRLWQYADEHTPNERVADYTQAVMDLGATLCVRSRPLCNACPMAEGCVAFAKHAVAEYPARRKRREMPVKRVRMFVLIDTDGRRLLERRPPTGLWGGLWGPLERAADHSVDEVLAELGAAGNAASISQLEPFRHTFTHFHLDIEPLEVTLSRPCSNVCDGDRLRWFNPQHDEPIGLSAVAARLLRNPAEFLPAQTRHARGSAA